MKVFLALPLLAILALQAGTAKIFDPEKEIAAQQKRIVALHQDLDPLVASLQQSNSDVRVFASFDPIVAAVASLNQLPAQQRAVSLQSTRAIGHFYDNKDLCNSYVELQGPGGLHASGVLAGFNAAAQEDGSLLLTAHAGTSGHLQVHWQYLGLRTRRGCPTGAGESGSTGLDFERGLDFSVRIGFAMAPDGQEVAYQATLLNPRRVDVRLSTSVEHIGNLPIPISINLPGPAIASGKFPLMIGPGATFVVPGTTGLNTHPLTLKPVSFAATKAGIVMEWNSAIDSSK